MYKKEDLKRNAQLADIHKKRFLLELEKLNVRFKTNLISKEDYENRLNTILRGRSIEDWISYYDKYKGACVNMIREDEQDTKFRAFLGILLIIVLAFPFLTNYTGGAVTEISNRISINKIVSPEAYLLIDGVAEPIPKPLIQKGAKMVYDIDYLELNKEVNTIQIIDDGIIVFYKELK